MRKKRIQCLLLSGMMGCLLLTGCGASTQRNEPTEEAASDIADEKASESTGDAETSTEAVEQDNDAAYDFTLVFAGDLNFDDSWSTMQFYSQQENGIYDCISQELIDEMNQVDVTWVNNEFTYSTNGSPMDGKAYTFRADPSHVEILQQLGVDIAGLANNHIYDYGETAFVDTLDTLSNAGIAYVGAGRNLEEAMESVYLEVDGKTVAFVAASRAEKNVMTPEATADTPGILRCYDTTLFKEEIAKAKEQADFVIACVHWGTEYSTTLEDAQLTTGKEYLDAGADVVIGAHTHCLQGFEFYDGKPIVYSLGNFWFNEKTLDTMLLKLHISGGDAESHIEMEVVPATQTGCQTIYAGTVEEQQRIYDYLESISVNAQIDEDGVVTQTP